MDLKGDHSILVVDDDKMMRESIELAFNELGYEKIVHANDGVEAMVKTKNQEFDVVITDICMPKMKGNELIDQLISVKTKSLIYIISGTVNAEIARQVKGNVVKIFVKPVDPNEIASVIHQQLEK